MRQRIQSRHRAAQRPLGVILAGGSGRRIGGSKAVVNLRGRPLISYPLQALQGALGDVAVVAKMDTELPDMPGVEVWIEPDVPRHPLVGIVHALELAGGRPVLVCATDMPFVTSALVRQIASRDPAGTPAVLASGDGRLEPLLGCYQPAALAALSGRVGEEGLRLTEAIAELGPSRYEVLDPAVLANVNSPDDLLMAAARLDRPRVAQPKVKS